LISRTHRFAVEMYPGRHPAGGPNPAPARSGSRVAQWTRCNVRWCSSSASNRRGSHRRWRSGRRWLPSWPAA